MLLYSLQYPTRNTYSPTYTSTVWKIFFSDLFQWVNSFPEDSHFSPAQWLLLSKLRPEVLSPYLYLLLPVPSLGPTSPAVVKLQPEQPSMNKHLQNEKKLSDTINITLRVEFNCIFCHVVSVLSQSKFVFWLTLEYQVQRSLCSSTVGRNFLFVCFCFWGGGLFVVLLRQDLTI